MEQGLLRNAPQGNEFVLHNGRVLKNLHELANALLSMDDGTFAHHLTKEKNDFASWIEHVFKNHLLADQVRGAKDRKEMARIILEKVNG